MGRRSFSIRCGEAGDERKTVGIRVAPGIIEVAAPSRTAIREIEEILRKRGKWILEKLEAVSEEPAPLQLVTGEAIPLLGKELTLLVEQDAVRRPFAHLDGRTLVVLVPENLPGDERQECARKAVTGWYKTQLVGHLKDRVAHWLPRVGGTEMPRVLVREQRARWGSCNADGTLRFSWRLAMLEPELVDSVVVHELAHLVVMNHSPAFWEVVLRAMPDAYELRKRLNAAGRQLRL